jgi:cytochrome c peroxidase
LNIKLGFILIFAFGTIILSSFSNRVSSSQLLIYPETWPNPNYDFTSNPLSPDGIDLGRMLFYDPILSADSTISCSSCHFSYTAFTHVDHATSHGIGDKVGRRNAPALMNLAWRTSFNWDGAVHHLDFQALAPIADSIEMGSSLKEVINSLVKTTHYPILFLEVFGASEITGELLLKSLAQFQLSLVSANSKYDRVKAGLEDFSEQEALGHNLFNEFCASCHQAPFFGGNDFADNAIGSNGLSQDFGLMEVSLSAMDSLKFRIPSLRNIKYSYPYMHDGRFEKLNQVIDHYLSLTANSYLDQRLPQGVTFRQEDRISLLSFLMTLNDLEFIFNKNHAYPRDLYEKYIKT